MGGAMNLKILNPKHEISSSRFGLSLTVEDLSGLRAEGRNKSQITNLRFKTFEIWNLGFEVCLEFRNWELEFISLGGAGDR